MVRDGDLAGAIKAYREADRRAPAEDKAEIASRLGWLAKETGDTRGAARQFRRSRGASALTVTYAIIAVTVIVSFTAWAGALGGPDIGQIYPALWLDKADVAAGQLWRLFTVTLVHSPDQTEFFLHLGFNMYALYLVGPVVEQIYGARADAPHVRRMRRDRLDPQLHRRSGCPGVGASGAIFGLFGVLLVASRVHNPVVDRRSRAILGQVGMLIVLNLVLGFGFGGGLNIDNAAHVGGLLGGLWLGLILLPAGAPYVVLVLASLGRGNAAGQGQPDPPALRRGSARGGRGGRPGHRTGLPTRLGGRGPGGDHPGHEPGPWLARRRPATGDGRRRLARRRPATGDGEPSGSDQRDPRQDHADPGAVRRHVLGVCRAAVRLGEFPDDRQAKPAADPGP